jgi:hypothetical protein
MSKSITGDRFCAEMTRAVLNGSEKPRNACREFLSDTGPSFENLHVNPEQTKADGTTSASQPSGFPERRLSRTRTRPSAQTFKQRFGLPEGFVPRLQRYGRSVLLELNTYRLPNGQEFIPVSPSGTLGTRRHLYALLSEEQYQKGKRGSVYIRTDGRIFDYSVDTANPSGDLFDTGYTIYDLERTGRYAPELRRGKKKRRQTRVKRAAASASEPGALATG